MVPVGGRWCRVVRAQNEHNFARRARSRVACNAATLCELVPEAGVEPGSSRAAIWRARSSPGSARTRCGLSFREFTEQRRASCLDNASRFCCSAPQRMRQASGASQPHPKRAPAAASARYPAGGPPLEERILFAIAIATARKTTPEPRKTTFIRPPLRTGIRAAMNEIMLVKEASPTATLARVILFSSDSSPAKRVVSGSV
jgi:hypothetical protein